MEGGLFSKYSQLLKNKQDKKNIIINAIKDLTGILVNAKEIQYKKDEILLKVSSTKRSQLILKNTKELLKEKGIIVSY